MTDLVAAQEERDRLAQVDDPLEDRFEAVQDDYFGFVDTKDVYLPDRTSYVTIQALNEGARRSYLNGQNREITVDRQTQDMRLKVESGEERFQLLKAAIVGWNLTRRNDKGDGRLSVPFNDREVKLFLTDANPKIIDIIDKEVRKQNMWLRQDMTVEDIDKAIAELEEQKAGLIKEQAAKNS